MTPDERAILTRIRDRIAAVRAVDSTSAETFRTMLEVVWAELDELVRPPANTAWAQGSGSRVETLPATVESRGGPHPPVMHRDEVELMYDQHEKPVAKMHMKAAEIEIDEDGRETTTYIPVSPEEAAAWRDQLLYGFTTLERTDAGWRRVDPGSIRPADPDDRSSSTRPSDPGSTGDSHGSGEA